MNDPHVVALYYRVEHGSRYNYDGVPSFCHKAETFDIRIEERQVSFAMKEHYATKEDARERVEEYIRGWELEAELCQGPNTFKLRFDRPHIEDRNPTPTPGTVHRVWATPCRFTFTVSEPSVVVSPSSYPSPPLRRLKACPDVQSMLHRLAGFRDGKEPLPGMVYFCLTVIEESAGGRKEAAAKFGISHEVLIKLGQLSSEKGGTGARKAVGINRELQSGEERFLVEAVEKIIRRVAEVAHDSSTIHPKITMSCFPEP